MKNKFNSKNIAVSYVVMVACYLMSNNAVAQYCYPTLHSGTNVCTYINSVTTSGAMTNITTPVDTGFNGNIYNGISYFATPVISQYAGQSFTLTVQANGTCDIAYFNVWVDWNRNEVFDSTEQVVNNVSCANNVTSFTINIPANAVIGTTRMRIINFGGGTTIGSCSNLNGYYSECEDYALKVVLFSGVNELDIGNAFSIYPNPLTSSSTLQLNTQVKNAEVVIYDLLGKEMMRTKLTGDRMVIARGTLVSGIYFVKVVNEDRQWVEKMVVE